MKEPIFSPCGIDQKITFGPKTYFGVFFYIEVEIMLQCFFQDISTRTSSNGTYKIDLCLKVFSCFSYLYVPLEFVLENEKSLEKPQQLDSNLLEVKKLE